MARQWQSIRGHKYGIPGIYYRDRAKPYQVRYTRQRRDIHVGSYQRLKDAIDAAKAFLRNE